MKSLVGVFTLLLSFSSFSMIEFSPYCLEEIDKLEQAEGILLAHKAKLINEQERQKELTRKRESFFGRLRVSETDILISKVVIQSWEASVSMNTTVKLLAELNLMHCLADLHNSAPTEQEIKDTMSAENIEEHKIIEMEKLELKEKL